MIENKVIKTCKTCGDKDFIEIHKDLCNICQDKEKFKRQSFLEF